MMDSETMECVKVCRDTCNDWPCYYSCSATCVVDPTIASCNNFDASTFDGDNIKDAEKDCLCTSNCVKTIGQAPEECANLCTKENNWRDLFYEEEDDDDNW